MTRRTGRKRCEKQGNANEDCDTKTKNRPGRSNENRRSPGTVVGEFKTDVLDPKWHASTFNKIMIHQFLFASRVIPENGYNRNKTNNRNQLRPIRATSDENRARRAQRLKQKTNLTNLKVSNLRLSVLKFSKRKTAEADKGEPRVFFATART